MIKRDKTIDRLRGLAMFWVLVVHVLYWGKFFNNELIKLLFSFSLFEMPLFFFVIGASNSFSKIEGNLKFICKRYLKLLIPYWVFALFCSAISIFFICLSNGMDLIYALKILISWLIPIDKQISCTSFLLTWALWFIPVYLSIILVIPVFKKINKVKFWNIVSIFILLGVFVITSLLEMGWIQHVTFYSIWTYIGLFYSDIMRKLEEPIIRKKIGIAVILGIATIVTCYMRGETIDMQYNKFPPNIIFCIFSFVMIAIVMLLIPYINKIYDYIEKNKIGKKIVELFSTKTMTIFLYQVFAFELTIRLTKILIPGNSILISSVQSIFCLMTTVPICIFFAYTFGKIENVEAKINKMFYLD